MTRQSLIEGLLSLPGEIEAAERDLLTAQDRLAEARWNLAYEEDQLLLSGCIDGKNAEQRTAQLRQHPSVVRERSGIDDREGEVRQAQIALNRKKADFSALKAVAGLLGEATVDKKTLACQMYERGMRLETIAELLHTDPSYIQNTLIERGITPVAASRLSPERIAEERKRIRLRKAAPKFVLALTRITDDSTALEWLNALLIEIAEAKVELPDADGETRTVSLISLFEDPDSIWTAHAAATEMVSELRDVLKSLEPKPVARVTLAQPDDRSYTPPHGDPLRKAA